ncbi:MAG: hypothetical protein ABIF01_04110, partial [Candidatus Micrarchaeota archaeon]
MEAQYSAYGGASFVNNRIGREYLLRRVEVWADDAKERNPNLEIIKLNLGNLTGPVFGASKEFTSILAEKIKDWDGGYLASRGYEPLVKAIADKQEKETGRRPDEDYVLTGEGGSWFIEKIISHTMDPQSGILLPEPG